jgi:predicted amidohydrolase
MFVSLLLDTASPACCGHLVHAGAMRVALVQFTASGDAEANRASLQVRLAELRPTVDLVVLPEAASHPFGPPDFDLGPVAEDRDGPFVGLLAEHARRLSATVVAGLFERGPGLPFNTLVVIGPDGSLVTAYRKIHLFDSFGYRESSKLATGPIEPVVIDVGGSRLGLLTCYDLRFPELGRLLADRGAEILLVPAAWLTGPHKLDQWRTLLAARAIENVCAVLAAAQGAPEYCGHSMAIDAMGTIVAEAGTGEQTLILDVDPAAVAAARELNPSLLNRRITR